MAPIDTNDDLAANALGMHHDVIRKRESDAALDAEQRLPADLAIAWRLFEHIAARDPASTSDKPAALATFRDCLAAVTRRFPTSSLASEAFPDAADYPDDVPF